MTDWNDIEFIVYVQYICTAKASLKMFFPSSELNGMQEAGSCNEQANQQEFLHWKTRGKVMAVVSVCEQSPACDSAAN